VAVNGTVRLVLLAFVGLVVAAGAIAVMPVAMRRRLTVTNHRGRPVPATLGIAVFSASAAAQLATGLALVVAGRHVGAASWGIAAGAAVVFAAGLLDDLRPGGPRGLAAHGRELLRLHITTGVLKALAGVAGALVVVLTVPGRSAWAMAAGVVLIAGSANVGNGLDVAPGRAGKLFVIGALPMLFLGPPGLLARVVGAEVAALWPDLRERGMLGDSGSNLLGFVLGAAAYMELSGVGVAVAAAVAVALNLVAETVTLSRTVSAIPPLRWLDRAGRIPAGAPAEQPSGAAPAPPL
jgi:UDP-N-acetylmuramyl pentapeptide phosphotransferase/UDP-N-acetylglucosamine-1-phosphate transferase